MRTLVVLPSYNERHNLPLLVDALVAHPARLDICIVDDSSPDGTPDVIKERLGSTEAWAGRVDLLVRKGKGGRGGAVREGLALGLASEQGYDTFVEMDCDFSHDPDELQAGLELIADGAGVAIGARYPSGVIIGWPLHRRVFSKIANFLARASLKWSVPDYTNGYRLYNREAVETLLSEPIRNTGFIYLSEQLAVLLRHEARVDHFPITFRNREVGVSNTNLREVSSALLGLFKVAWWYRVTSKRQS